jgi:hypothetical protein
MLGVGSTLIHDTSNSVTKEEFQAVEPRPRENSSLKRPLRIERAFHTQSRQIAQSQPNMQYTLSNTFKALVT